MSTVVLTVPAMITTFIVQPHVGTHFLSRPWGFIFPAIGLIGLIGMGYYNIKQQDKLAFFSSSTFIVGMLASAAFGLYPYVLPAVIPANSLTIQNASASQYAQTVGLAWWTLGMILASIYFIFTYRHFGGKIRLEDITEGYS